jgi:hypothetical protein
MFTKKVDHPVYGTITVQKEDFLEFHRTLAGLKNLEEAADEYQEKGGVSPDQMHPGFIKVRDGGKEIVYYKILAEGSNAEFTLGTTQDGQRFPLYNRDDAFWEPDQGPRPNRGSREQGGAPQGQNSPPPRGEQPGGDSAPSAGGDGRSSGSETRTLAMKPSRTDEADEIQKIKNVSEEWADRTLSETHQKTIWKHLQRIRNETPPRDLLDRVLDKVGSEDLEINYSQASSVIRMIEDPDLPYQETPEVNPDDELPF